MLGFTVGEWVQWSTLEEPQEERGGRGRETGGRLAVGGLLNCSGNAYRAATAVRAQHTRGRTGPPRVGWRTGRLSDLQSAPNARSCPQIPPHLVAGSGGCRTNPSYLIGQSALASHVAPSL